MDDLGVPSMEPPTYYVLELWMVVRLSLLPVVPHKAVAEVSKWDTYRRGWLL